MTFGTRFSKIFKGDPWIWAIVILLSLIGILAVYSATVTLAFSKHGGNTEFYFLRHTGFLLIGLFFLYLCHLVNYLYFSRLSQLFLWISIGLLLVTLFVGSEINNATRVLPIPGLGITFQTSDMAKLFLMMYIARYLSKNQEEINSFSVFRNILIVILIVVALIAPENLSTSLVVFVTCCMLLFIGRINMKYLALLAGTGIVLLTVLIVTLLSINTENLGNTRIPTWKKRIETFTNKDGGEGNYQQLQSKIAVATGGFFGKGPGNSTQRAFLPHPYSDFIYAIIVEEYGWFGGALVVALFILLIFRCIRIVVESPKAFGALLALGLCFSMSFQAFVNMGVAVGILPVTGLTIPLVSMGGTSLVFNSIAFGVILSVSRSIQENKDKEPTKVAA
ncbi:MAG: FtsW/RodA/SpoVE family cell cycle protein [Bacteroidetes bacterium]|nr:FtsW/RodA/SpoVE family cell cycle protein [Bacteroidota bacterium]